MLGFHPSRPSGDGAHHQRGRPGVPSRIADPSQQLAVGDSSDGHKHIVPPAEVIHSEDPIHVVTLLGKKLSFSFISRPEPALHVAPEALQHAYDLKRLWRD